MAIDTGNLQDSGIPMASDYLDLVALGTVADVAPLTFENRALVRQGLEYLRRPHRQGIMSLIGVSRLHTKRITAQHIGFALGPRLNAAGRLDSALAALELLRTQDVHRAAYLAQALDDQNRERQVITRHVQDDAEECALADDPEALLLFAAGTEYNPGVVGLAAGRLTEKYYRPSIVAHQGDETTRASCRSIPEFHITNALDRCADLLEQHGGHAAAAGFTVRNDNLPELVERLKIIAAEQLGALDLRPKIEADMEIELFDLRPELLRELDWLQPTGHKNPQANFVSRHLKVNHSRTVGKDNAHLKMSVTDGRITYDAIAFRQGHWQENMPAHIDLLYVFELNEFNGRSMLQLNVRDIKPSGSA
jgi:single-stranded-DNA-specific exonuclease